MQTAVLGLGRMGQALAARLVGGGHRVTVWNRSPGHDGDLVRDGANRASTIAEAVSGADVVFTMVANDDAVRALALGSGGVAANLAAGSVYIDSSTISPALADELASTIEQFVAMPVLGSPAVLRSGQAVALLGGAPDQLAKVEPAVASITSTVRRYPRAVLAATAKVTSNLVLLEGLVALAEAFAVGRGGGLSDDDLRDLLAESPLVAPALRNRFEAVLTGDQQPWWAPALGAKDVGLALQTATAAGIDLPAASVARQAYLQAADDDPDGDVAAVARRYRRT